MISIPLVSILLWILAAAIWYFFLSAFIWGAGYAPTSMAEVGRVGDLLNLRVGDVFYDLGSGYGRMLFAIADRYDVSCVGVEIDPLKCWWTNFMIKRKKLRDRVSVIQSNFLKVNLKDADRVFLFLSSSTDIMDKIREKLLSEMKGGALVISYTHKFKDWKPSETSGKLFLYHIPNREQVT